MTEAQLKFIALEKRKEDVKKFFEELSLATEAVVQEIGLNKYFQDGDGIVYKTTVPDGKFVYFEKFSIDRTRRAGEKSGSLSLKEAKENGFVVE